MSDIHVEEHVASQEGGNPNNGAETIQTPRNSGVSGSVQTNTTRTWSAKPRGIDLVWLVAGIIDAILALDFIFHAAGANSVGFASLIFSMGTFFAAPFAGIFNTTYAAHGNLIIWADVLAVAVYFLVALALVKLVGVMSHRSA